MEDSTQNDSPSPALPSQQQRVEGNAPSSTLLKLTYTARGGAAARITRGRRHTGLHQQHRASKHISSTTVTTAVASVATDNNGAGQKKPQQQSIQQLLDDADECEDIFMTSAAAFASDLSMDDDASTKLWAGELQGGAVSHPTLQDVSVSSLLQQQVPFDETAMMHSGFYGSREEVEKLLAQAIQMRCRTKGGGIRLLGTPAEWNSLDASQPPFSSQQPQATRQPAAPSGLLAISSSVRSLADNLAEAWANSSGAAATAKSVRFHGEAASAADAEMSTPPQQERRLLFMTDSSSEEESQKQDNPHCQQLTTHQSGINYPHQQMSQLFLSAKPPLPKPRASQQPGTIAGTGVTNEESAMDLSPIPVPTPRVRRYPQVTAVAQQAAAHEPPPMPKPRRLLLTSTNNSVSTDDPSVVADASDYDDNSTVRPDHVGTVLEGLLQARIQLTRPPGASTGDTIFGADVQSSLTTERRPMDTGPRIIAAGPSASTFASTPATAVTASAGNRRLTAPVSRYAR